MAGAPLGNKNAAKAKVWTAAIERALERRASERKGALDELADKLIDMALAGDLSAIKEFGDRIEGKPTQTFGGSEDHPPIQLQKIERQIVRPDNSNG